MSFSVIIPTLAEASTIAGAVTSAGRAFPGCEVVVADGGSDDGTDRVAAAAGATVVHAPGTRAAAMNRAAALATGDVLVFLHADTRLPPGAAQAVSDALAGGTGIGCFHVRFDRRRPLLERLISVRSTLLGVAYGDQALFVSADAFVRCGGFRPIPIMEDFDLVRRLRGQGGLAVLPAAVTTSGRRHQQSGRARTLVRIWLIQLLYLLRVPPERLARLYPPVR